MLKELSAAVERVGPVEALRQVRVPVEPLIDAVARIRALPQQLSMDSKFGDPPITLWWGRQYLIDVYFWRFPETAVHSHSFSGAFTVLQGLSLQVTYDFRKRRRYGDVAVGRMRRRSAELLRPGDVREIRSESALIHRVIHLSRPSISLVVRTRRDRAGARILQYLEPSLCVPSPLHLSPSARKKLRLIDYLRSTHDPRLGARVRAMIDGVPDAEALWYAYQSGDARVATGRPWADELRRCLQVRQVDWRKITAESPRLRAALAAYVGVRLNDTGEIVLRSMLDGGDACARIRKRYDAPRTLEREVRDCARALAFLLPGRRHPSRIRS